MDFMFEDEADEVGSDVEAYCPKCKGDTTHVVISKYEDEVRRVQCNPCGDVHSYRKPRGDVEEDLPEPVAARKRALLKKLTWEEFFAKHGEKDPKPYEFRECYRENHIVLHPKFGKGFISEVVSDSKVEVTFQDGRRILVHNRRDIPGLPLAAEGDGTPTPGTGRGASRSKSSKSKIKVKPKAVAPAAKTNNSRPDKKAAAKGDRRPARTAPARPAAKPAGKAAAKKKSKKK